MHVTAAGAHDDSGTARRRRVFFALWPDEPVRGAIAQATRGAVRQCGGRPTPRANLHMTLAFLGPLTTETLEKVLALTPPPTAPFELLLDRLGLWEHAQVLWIGPTEIPEPLTQLEAGLWDALVAIGLERERRPYRPHVTIARKAQAARGTLVPLGWPVGEIALVESQPGPRSSRYATLKTWALSTGDQQRRR